MVLPASTPSFDPSIRHFHVHALSGSSSGLGRYPGFRAAETIGGPVSSSRAWTKASRSFNCSTRYFRYRTASSGPRWIPSSLATATTASTSGTEYMGLFSSVACSGGLESDGLAVRAAFGSGEITVLHPVDQLRAAELGAHAVGHGDVMAATLQFLVHLGHEAGFEIDLEPCVDAPARRVGRGLRILPVIGEADHRSEERRVGKERRLGGRAVIE